MSSKMALACRAAGTFFVSQQPPFGRLECARIRDQEPATAHCANMASKHHYFPRLREERKHRGLHAAFSRTAAPLSLPGSGRDRVREYKRESAKAEEPSSE